jgi:hypothetical protein
VCDDVIRCDLLACIEWGSCFDFYSRSRSLTVGVWAGCVVSISVTYPEYTTSSVDFTSTPALYVHNTPQSHETNFQANECVI